MRIVYIFMIALFALLPVSVYAQTATPDPDDIEFMTMGDTSANEYVPQFQDTHENVLRSLDLEDTYSFSMIGEPSTFGHERLPDDTVDAFVSFARSSVTYPCNNSDGTIPSNVTGLDGVAGTWSYSQYKNCNGLSGPACAAALSKTASYTYFYTDLGRGSYFHISYLSFDGASVGDTPPASNTYSPQNFRWSSKVFYRAGSARDVSPNVALTPIPAGSWQVISASLWHPQKIFVNDMFPKYINDTNLTNKQIGYYSVQISVPAVIAKSFRPRVTVCAVRPTGYDPVKAATQVAQHTSIAQTATKSAGNTAPRSPTPVTATYWDANLQKMWENSREYIWNIYHPNLSLSYVNFYGATNQVPTTLLSGLRIRIYRYDRAAGNVVGALVQDSHWQCQRGAMCTISAATIAERFSYFNTSNYIMSVSCPVVANRVCPPFDDSRFTGWYANNIRIKSGKASNTIFSLDPHPRGDGTQNFIMTATAYKTLKTPTRTTAPTFTAVRTFTPIPTVATRTSIPTVLSTAGAQTATAHVLHQRQTATAYARVVQTATSHSATSAAQITNVVRTATAAINQTQTVQAQVTSVIQLTQTAIANIVGTLEATQQVYIDKTKTAISLADDADAAIRPNLPPQIDVIDDVADGSGPGEVIKVITDATTALDRGLDGSPCNGFPDSLGGFSTRNGAYEITDDLAVSLCQVQEWLDTDQTFVPFVRTIVYVILVLVFVVTIMYVIRGFLK